MALPPRVPLTKDVDVVAWMRGEGLQADLIERVKGSLSGEVLLSEQDRISLGKLLREVMGIAPMDAFAIASKVYPTASGPPPVQPSGGWSSLAKEETKLFASSPLREPLIEGVEVGHYLSLDRFPLCAHFRHLFTQYSAVIFRSPPHSGKTSIASLLADYLARSTSIKTYYVCATLANYDSAPPSAEDPALRAWNWQLRTFETVSGTLTEIMDVSNKTDRLLVLDEAQMWFKLETAQLPTVAANFWAKLKVVPMDGPLRVLVLSTYMSSSLSSATPFTFAPGAQVALPDTLLSSEEMSELFRRWSTAYDLRLTPLVQQYLRRLTGGHIGYLTGLLSGLRQKRGLYKQEDPETLYLNTLAYPGEVLNYCRIAPSSHLDAKYEKLLKALLFKWAGLPFEEVAREAGLGSNELEAAKSTLCHMGYIVETNEHKLQLTARVLHFYLAPILISPTNKEPLTTPDELLRRILRLCDPKRVADSLSRSATGAPNEYTWQGEFYVALCQCLPKGVSASISFGHGYGTDGAVDFYINSKYKWAFELTREGDRLTEHVDRFVKANGLYYKLTQEARDKPCVIKEWRVVDIRRKKVYTKTMLDGVVYAIYDKTFTKFTLKRKDKDDESVAVESTMALRRAASLNRELNISSPAKAPP